MAAAGCGKRPVVGCLWSGLGCAVTRRRGGARAGLRRQRDERLPAVHSPRKRWGSSRRRAGRARRPWGRGVAVAVAHRHRWQPPVRRGSGRLAGPARDEHPRAGKGPGARLRAWGAGCPAASLEREPGCSLVNASVQTKVRMRYASSSLPTFEFTGLNLPTARARSSSGARGGRTSMGAPGPPLPGAGGASAVETARPGQQVVARHRGMHAARSHPAHAAAPTRRDLSTVSPSPTACMPSDGLESAVAAPGRRLYRPT